MKKLIVVALFLNLAVFVGIWHELSAIAEEGGGAGPTPSGNGDVNGSGDIDIADASYLLNWLFLGGPAPVAIAQNGGSLTPEQEEILSHMSIVELPLGEDVIGTAKTIRFTGVNVQIVNGLGATNGNPGDPRDDEQVVNGLGNLVVGILILIGILYAAMSRNGTTAA